jgi:DNA-binding transcriptional LysR family regulator
MNWRMLDLNLLVVFDAVIRERNATRAAARLNMTQPAISHALNLFVRTPDGMEPTPYAEQLAGPVRAALESLRTALDGAAPFEPETADRGFTLAMDNRAVVVLAAAVAAAIGQQAPRVQLTIRPSGTLNLPELLDRGELDMAVAGFAGPAERFADLRLFEDDFVALVRRGHPAAANGTISLQALADHPHLMLSSTGEETGFVDAHLARQELTRSVALRVPLLAAAATLAQSDMIAVLSASTARAFAVSVPLDVLSLPFPSPRQVTAMLWHRRMDNVPAHQWLRGLVSRVARAVVRR